MAVAGRSHTGSLKKLQAGNRKATTTAVKANAPKLRGNDKLLDVIMNRPSNGKYRLFTEAIQNIFIDGNRILCP